MFIWAAFLVINDRKDLHDSMTLYSHERRRHAVVLTAFAYCFGHVEALHALIYSSFQLCLGHSRLPYFFDLVWTDFISIIFFVVL
jgi:hypothetical protein